MRHFNWHSNNHLVLRKIGRKMHYTFNLGSNIKLVPKSELDKVVDQLVLRKSNNVEVCTQKERKCAMVKGVFCEEGHCFLLQEYIQ